MKGRPPIMRKMPKPVKPRMKTYTEAEVRAISEQVARDMTFEVDTDCVAQLRDLVIIAVAESFGAGPVRMERFLLKLNEVCDEYAELIHANSASAEEKEYARAKVDERLKPILGGGWAPFEERYPNDKKRNT